MIGGYPGTHGYKGKVIAKTQVLWLLVLGSLIMLHRFLSFFLFFGGIEVLTQSGSNSVDNKTDVFRRPWFLRSSIQAECMGVNGVY
jgi:hypothetical protein